MIRLVIAISLTLLSFSSRAQIFPDFETDSITTSTLVASSYISSSEGWMADEAGVVWHTTDAAESWSPVCDGIYLREMDFKSALVGYGISSAAAYKTINGGISWSQLLLPGAVGSALYFLDEFTGFISGYGVIYKTTDGGSSWTTISIEGISIVDYFFFNDAVGIAVANDDDSFQTIWRTTDGGATWSSVYGQEKYFFHSVWFTSETAGFAAGYYAKTGRGKFPVIHRTDDGGLMWQNVYMNRDPGDRRGEEFFEIRFSNQLEGFALASYSESVSTLDGGLTWHFTRDEEGNEVIPDWGVYKTLGGFN